MSARVVVVGGGVAGLAAAYRLLERDPSLQLTVLEAGPAPGGKLATAEVAGLELDAGPDSFVARKPWAVDLCRELGLELVAPGVSGAFVWTDRGLVEMPPTALGVPADIDDLARWAGLSRSGRLRALSDLVRKPHPPEDEESLGSLLRRRLGDEAAEVLVGSLLAGLFAGDLDRLGIRATFPELASWELDHGSLIRGAKAARRLARDAGPIFLRPAGGVGRLPAALLGAIGTERVLATAAATSIEPEGSGSVVRVGDREFSADAVVVSTPAFVAADLLRELAPEAARALGSIPYASTGVVLLVYPEGTADALPAATGFVVPAGKAPMTAATFLSRKWPDAEFGTRAVLRCFAGGVGAEDVLDASDGDIVEAVCRHLAAALPLPEVPTASAVVRWPRAMPQYEVGHLERVAAIEGALPPGIVVAGNAYRGVGVADTVRSANEAADAVRAHLTERTERVR